jgi:hypothetical protein
MHILWRRRLFFFPAVALALIVTAGVYLSVKPTYSAETILLLVPPSAASSSSSTTSGVVTSPYDSYGSLNTVASIVSSAESSQVAVARLARQGVGDTYTVTPDPTGDTPEILATATAASPVVAMQWDAIIAKDVVGYVHNFQKSSGASASTFVQTNYLARPAKALRSDKSRLRVGIAVGVVTLLLALSLTLIFDSMLSQNSERRSVASVPAEGQSAEDDFSARGISSMRSTVSRGRTSALRRP